ncbi:XkdF-like putative serine protease domain-containing protein [Bacillus sp. FSL K6-0047]
MPNELRNARITHVSYVDKGANQKSFFITKADNKDEAHEQFRKSVKAITKEDDEQQLVYGVVYEPDVVDSHGDYMTAEEIEKAAHYFMKEARNIDTQHDFESGVGEVVESYVAPADFTMGDTEIKKGSWVLVTKASDEIWEQIKKGDITGYSMAGLAESIKKEEVSSDESSIKEAFFTFLKSFIPGKEIEKGEVRDNYERHQARRNLWALWESLDDAFHESIRNNPTPEVADFDRILAATQDFVLVLSEIKTPEAVQKAMADKPKGDEDVDIEQIKKALKEELEPINERLEKLEKEEGAPDDSNEPGDEESELLKQLKAVIKEEMAAIDSRLTTVEKSRGNSKQHDQEEVVEKQEDFYLKGIY